MAFELKFLSIETHEESAVLTEKTVDLNDELHVGKLDSLCIQQFEPLPLVLPHFLTTHTST